MNNYTVIEANRGVQGYWKDIWRYRELFAFFVWRDLTVRYKQTFLGVTWSLLRPIVTMIAFTFIFGKIAKLPSGGVPYPVLVFAALIPWQFFASALSDCGNSLVSNSHLLSKIYFPRLIIPGSSLIVSLVDFLVSVTLLAALMVYYQIPLTWRILTVPFFAALTLFTAGSVGLLIATIMVKYRDFRIILQFLIQFGLYVSPVGYTSDLVPEQWRFVYSLNPMAGIIDGFRWALLGGKFTVEWTALAISMTGVLLVGIAAFRYFRSTERGMADII